MDVVELGGARAVRSAGRPVAACCTGHGWAGRGVRIIQSVVGLGPGPGVSADGGGGKTR